MLASLHLAAESVTAVRQIGIQSNFDGSNLSGPSVRVRLIHVFERFFKLVHVF